MAEPNNPVDDFIEVLIPELDTGTAIACVIGGLVLGGVIAYALVQQSKAGRIRSPFGAPDVEPTYETESEAPQQLPAAYSYSDQ